MLRESIGGRSIFCYPILSVGDSSTPLRYAQNDSLSKPVLATIGLWTAVANWNHWFDAMLYIASDENQVLQTFILTSENRRPPT